MVARSNRRRYARQYLRSQALQGDADKWDQWPEIRRCNPLTAISPRVSGKKLLSERDAARCRFSRLKARFLSYRLNLPSRATNRTMLLTVDDWERVTARPVADRDGKPIVGVDLGAGRAWSAAVAIWKSGRDRGYGGSSGHSYADRAGKARQGAKWDLHAAL